MIIYDRHPKRESDWHKQDSYWNDLKPWKEEQRPAIHRQVIALDNQELLDEYAQLAGGDDYDGCHTDGGTVVWEELQKELTLRLTAIGFLEEQSNENAS